MYVVATSVAFKFFAGFRPAFTLSKPTTVFTDQTKAKLLALIPPLLLLLVAGIQIYLAKTANLTPWKGGGFGMFSTNDGNANRYLRIVVSGPQRSEELILQGNLEDLAARVQMFPGDHQLSRLAKTILQDQHKKNLPADTIYIEVFRTEFNKITLLANAKRIRDYTYTEKSQ